ncbi:MAG: D-glycero-beta-D-manno-heptose 1-phosphate adenylyltransferase [Cyclobacteriaceae bacterium]|nr:D-glycero-beta-D-manno-heptose 1-phosphate adenylyltransferase [Cyclobacteriaceae bacterium]
MYNTAKKICSWDEAAAIVADWQKENKKVVFTNGCFDILHLGHVDYLEKSRNLGDKMVVGVNSDRSVSDLKGPSRPVSDELSRTRVMASLAFVDLVVIFGEETPFELISKLKPDILVKGSDYLAENIVGADIVIANGGEVKTIDLVDGYSTSNVIKFIKNH